MNIDFQSVRCGCTCGFQHILFGVSGSLMADTVFKADFRGSCTFDPTGLKEDDSSVEIYVQNMFNMETTHTHTQVHANAPTHTNVGRQIQNTCT